MDKKYHQWTTIEFCGFLFKNCIHVTSPGKCFKFRDIIYQCGYEYVQHSRRQRSSPSKQKDTEIGSLVLGGAALGEQQQQQCIIPTSYVREVGMDGVMMKWFWAEAQQSSAVLLFGRSRGEVVNRTLGTVHVSGRVERQQCGVLLRWVKWECTLFYRGEECWEHM